MRGSTEWAMVSSMDVLRQHEISESSHRILNAFDDRRLMLLGEICRLQPGQQLLDLACGKGEMLCRWAEHYGIGGLGVDFSKVFTAAARERAVELGVADRVRIERADASTYEGEPASYDIVSCIGATWIGGGPAGTIQLMRPALRPGGLLLVGEPYWVEEPPAEAFRVHPPGEFTTLEGTMDRFASVGAELVEMVLADGDCWDRYAAAHWWNIHAWLQENPDDPDVPVMREQLESRRRDHLAWRRRCLGWGVFVLRSA
jgi:SAM-dependent methyltransferase